VSKPRGGSSDHTRSKRLTSFELLQSSAVAVLKVVGVSEGKDGYVDVVGSGSSHEAEM